MRYVAVFILALLVVACEATAVEPTPRPTATARPQRVNVQYVVTTSARNHEVSLTYENAGGNTEQLQVEIPERRWRKEMRVRRGAFLYVSVQNREDGGSVGCEILVDGVVVERAESSGAYVIATCSGSAR